MEEVGPGTWSSRTGTTLRATSRQKFTSKDSIQVQRSWNQEIAGRIRPSLRRWSLETRRSRTTSNLTPPENRHSRRERSTFYFRLGEGWLLQSARDNSLQEEDGVADFSGADRDPLEAREDVWRMSVFFSKPCGAQRTIVCTERLLIPNSVKIHWRRAANKCQFGQFGREQYRWVMEYWWKLEFSLKVDSDSRDSASSANVYTRLFMGRWQSDSHSSLVWSSCTSQEETSRYSSWPSCRFWRHYSERQKAVGNPSGTSNATCCKKTYPNRQETKAESWNVKRGIVKTELLTARTTFDHLVFKRTCVGSMVSRLKMSCMWLATSFSKVIPSPHHRDLLGPCNPPHFPDVLVTELGANCADPRGGSWFGRIAEQSPLTSYEPNSRVEISSEYTPTNFLSRRTSFTTDLNNVPSDERQLTSPLSTQERGVIASPFSASVHKQAAASGSQQQPASSSVIKSLANVRCWNVEKSLLTGTRGCKPSWLLWKRCPESSWRWMHRSEKTLWSWGGNGQEKLGEEKFWFGSKRNPSPNFESQQMELYHANQRAWRI